MLRSVRVFSEGLRNRLREVITGVQKLPVIGPDEVEDVGELIDDLKKGYEVVDKVYAARKTRVEQVGKKVLCKGAGCSWCCYDDAMASPPEMLVVIAAFQKLSPEDQCFVAGQNERWMEAHADQDYLMRVHDSPEAMRAHSGILEAEGIQPDYSPIGQTTSRSHER